jgi:hypothetical protein
MTYVLVNGSPSDEFFMRYGLRHGDPLSPFLFFIAIEGFNLLFSKVISLKTLCGFQVDNNRYFKVTHFQFVNDTLIIGKKKKKLVQYIVLKLGPDRPVRPVEPWTGDMTGSVSLLDRTCSWTGQNRYDSQKTGKNRWLGRFGEPDRVNKKSQKNWKKKITKQRSDHEREEDEEDKNMIETNQLVINMMEVSDLICAF